MPTNASRAPVRPAATDLVRPRRRGTELVTCGELLRLLNDDFAREYRSIFAHAVFAERLREAGRADLAAAVERRGKLEVAHALALCRVVYDFGGSVVAPADELNAVLNADRAAGRGWSAETVRRLKERARQLRAAGEPGLAKRVASLAAAKLAAPELAEVLCGSSKSEARNPKQAQNPNQSQ